MSVWTGAGADPGFGNGGGGGKISSEASYIYKESYERREYTSAGGPEIFLFNLSVNFERNIFENV